MKKSVFILFLVFLILLIIPFSYTSTYTVGSEYNFETLTNCMNVLNGTGHICVLNEPNTSYTFETVKGLNRTSTGLLYEEDFDNTDPWNTTFMCSVSAVSSTFSYAGNLNISNSRMYLKDSTLAQRNKVFVYDETQIGTTTYSDSGLWVRYNTTQNNYPYTWIGDLWQISGTTTHILYEHNSTTDETILSNKTSWTPPGTATWFKRALFVDGSTYRFYFDNVLLHDNDNTTGNKKADISPDMNESIGQVGLVYTSNSDCTFKGTTREFIVMEEDYMNITGLSTGWSVDVCGNQANESSGTARVMVGNCTFGDPISMKVYNVATDSQSTLTMEYVWADYAYGGDVWEIANISAFPEYHMTDDAIRFNANNQTLNCSGIWIIGDGDTGDVGIENNRKGNMTLKNCNLKNFGRGISLDGYTAVFNTFLIENIIVNDSTSNDRIADFKGNVTNLVMHNCQEFYIINRGSTTPVYLSDIVLNNMSTGVNGAGIYLDAGDYVNIDGLTITQSSVSSYAALTFDSETNNANLTNCEINATAGQNAIYFEDSSTDLFNRIENCTVRNGKNGIYVGSDYNDIINVSIFNTSSEGIRIEGNYNQIINSTFNFTGNSTMSSNSLVSYSPITYGGDDYDETSYQQFYSSVCGTTNVNSDDTIISWADGSTNIKCYAFDLTTDLGCGTGKTMLCLHPTCYATYTCAALELAGYGTCMCDNGDTWMANGVASDYTWNNSPCNFGIVSGYTDPPYLRADPTNYISPINLFGDNNNITGNTVYNSSDTMYYSLAVDNGSDNNNIWLNNFYFGSVFVFNEETGNSLCVGNEGNFYEESLIPATGDCGQVNSIISTPINKKYNITWTKQSSCNTVYYHLFVDSTEIIKNTTSLYYELDTTNMTDGYYRATIIPFVMDNNRINGTNNITNEFVISNIPLGQPGYGPEAGEPGGPVLTDFNFSVDYKHNILIKTFKNQKIKKHLMVENLGNTHLNISYKCSYTGVKGDPCSWIELKDNSTFIYVNEKTKLNEMLIMVPKNVDVNDIYYMKIIAVDKETEKQREVGIQINIIQLTWKAYLEHLFKKFSEFYPFVANGNLYKVYKALIILLIPLISLLGLLIPNRYKIWKFVTIIGGYIVLFIGILIII